MSGHGWIVGNGSGDRWRAWTGGVPEWIESRDEATRYARREDAEAVHAEDEGAWSIVPYEPALTTTEASGEVVQADRNLDLLIGLLHREGTWSGVWFANKLLEAAQHLRDFRDHRIASQPSVEREKVVAWLDWLKETQDGERARDIVSQIRFHIVRGDHLTALATPVVGVGDED